MKWISILFGVALFLYILSVESKEDQVSYDIESAPWSWVSDSTCRDAIELIKSRISEKKLEQLHQSKCSIEKLPLPLPGSFPFFEPFAVTWPGGVSVRVINERGGLQFGGFSSEGIPAVWKPVYEPIKKSSQQLSQECHDLFNVMFKASNISVSNVNIFEDNRGANVDIAYTSYKRKAELGSCLFRREKLITASIKSPAGGQLKEIYKSR